MAQLTGSSGGRYCTVGDYMVEKQIGAGSFSTVWHARHRANGTEVAIKEIFTSRLNYELRESLKSEIFILKKINHPNIIRLHDMIEVEAPSLVLNPPFSLKSSDRNRIQNYIDVLNKRQRISESRIMAVFKSEDQPTPP